MGLAEARRLLDEAKLDAALLFGGKGSGHWGHGGIPGEVGGSADSGGNTAEKYGAVRIKGMTVAKNEANYKQMDAHFIKGLRKMVGYDGYHLMTFADNRASAKRQIQERLTSSLLNNNDFVDNAMEHEGTYGVESILYEAADSHKNEAERQKIEGVARDLKDGKIGATHPYISKIAMKQNPTMYTEAKVSAASARVRQLIDNWADTSGDADFEAIGIQLATVAEFGLQGQQMSHFAPGTIHKVQEFYSREPQAKAATQAFVRAMYNETQRDLKAAGIKEVYVYRGMRLDSGRVESAGVGGGALLAEVAAQPVSSFSTNFGVATNFASTDSGDASVIMLGVVPASRILSTARTGFGCLSEREVTVLGGTDTFKTYIAAATDSEDDDLLDLAKGSTWTAIAPGLINVKTMGKERAPSAKLNESVMLGGPGSGNWGHAGIPGEVGGSDTDGLSTAEKYGAVRIKGMTMKEASSSQAKSMEYFSAGLTSSSLRPMGALEVQKNRVSAKKQVQKKLLAKLKGNADFDSLAAKEGRVPGQLKNHIFELSHKVQGQLSRTPGSQWSGDVNRAIWMRNSVGDKVDSGEISVYDERVVEIVGKEYVDKLMSEARSGLCRDLVDTWAKTSAGVSHFSIGVQVAAAAEFGLHGQSMAHIAGRSDGSALSYVQETFTKDPTTKAAMRAFVRAQYEQTQEELAAAGIDEMYVYRGMKLQKGTLASGSEQETGIVELGSQPMSSFSTHPDIARRFSFSRGEGEFDSVVLVGIVPSSRIVATCRTGVGCLAEAEVVVLGGTDQFKYSALQYSKDLPWEKGSPDNHKTEQLLGVRTYGPKKPEVRELDDVKLGGKGSGHWGHTGIPGEVGGSGDGGGTTAEKYGAVRVKGMTLGAEKKSLSKMLDSSIQGSWLSRTGQEDDFGKKFSLTVWGNRVGAKQQIQARLSNDLKDSKEFNQFVMNDPKGYCRSRFAAVIRDVRRAIRNDLEDQGYSTDGSFERTRDLLDLVNDVKDADSVDIEAVRIVIGQDAANEILEDSRMETVDYLVRSWANTSADSDLQAISLQVAAVAEFKLGGQAMSHFDGRTLTSVQEAFNKTPSNKIAMQQFLRAQYSETQRQFESAGIKEVYVFRGMTLSREDVAGFGIHDANLNALAEVSSQPLSSFAYDYQESITFAGVGAFGDDISVLMAGIVPVERILSTARTGFGCLNETELVLLGGTDEFKVSLGNTRAAHDKERLLLTKTIGSKRAEKVEIKKKLNENVALAQKRITPALAKLLAAMFVRENDFFDVQQRVSKSVIRATSATSADFVGSLINMGRDLVAKKTARYAQYSAILDDDTCSLCEALDGQVVEVGSEEYKRYMPRVHNHCRCIWVYIDEPGFVPPPFVPPPDDLVERHGHLIP